MPDGMTTSDAIRTLGITRATLYAYASRGRVRRWPGADGRSRYHPEDIARLASQAAVQRDPLAAVEGAFQWGVPLIPSSVSTIIDGTLSYRGIPLDACVAWPVERLAAVLWHGPEAQPVVFPRVRTPITTHAHPLRRMQQALIGADGTPVQLIARLLAAWTGCGRGGPLAGRVSWSEAGRIAVVLAACADHEMTAATLAVRAAASTGASLSDALLAGLAAFQGPRQGLAPVAAVRLLATAMRHGPQRALAEAGAHPVGFGHQLYPAGDPRARVILETCTGLRTHAATRQLIAGAGRPANIDLALAAFVLGHDRPAEDALALFALGRCLGWIAHAQEQATQGLLRPRAGGALG